MKDPVEELRVTLHRAADLITDMLAHGAAAPRAARRRTAGGEIPVDDLTRKRAENTLKQLGWPVPQKKGPRK